MTRRSRSRSRQRPTEDVDEKEEHDVDDGDFETITENDAENSKERAKRLLQEVAEDECQTPRPKRLASSRSPGHTPKSAIHRNLAKIGMLDSPPTDEGRGLLQEFCECLAETDGLDGGPGARFSMWEVGQEPGGVTAPTHRRG